MECSLSEEEKHDSQEVADIPENKSEKKKTKRRGARMRVSKVKGSESDDSQNNCSDEDYSPQSKRKMKKSPAMRRSTKRLVESRKGRGGNAKNFQKKSTEYESDNKNVDVISTERADNLVEKNEMEEELEKESSVDKSDSNNSENEERSTKGKKTRRSNVVSNIVLPIEYS